MNRLLGQKDGLRSSVPHMRGDEPRVDELIELLRARSPHAGGLTELDSLFSNIKNVFPTYVGMNPSVFQNLSCITTSSISS